MHINDAVFLEDLCPYNELFRILVNKKDKPEKFKSFAFAFKANYHIPQNVENFADHIQEPKHAEWIEMFLRSLGE